MPNDRYLEYIPQLDMVTSTGMRVEKRMAIAVIIYLTNHRPKARMGVRCDCTRSGYRYWRYRAYAEAYAEEAYALALVSSAMVEEERHGNDVRQNRLLLQRLNGHLVKLLANCEHLPMTALSVKSLLEIINSPETMRAWDRAEMVLHTSLAEVQSRLRDELSLKSIL